MTDDGDCESYRESIFERAETNDDLGAIWIDDSVGSILMALEEKGILDDTIFVFQADHGVDPKAALYEGGVRIPQFIHYPNKISAGTKFDSPISVMDTAAAVLDYAGIVPSYDIDGTSWKEVIAGNDSETNWKDRCLHYEMGKDRAARCGCYKYLEIYDQNDSTTFRRGNAKGLSNDERNLFNLCGQSEDEYLTLIRGRNMEAMDRNLIEENPITASQLETIQQCHLERIMNGSYDSCQLDMDDTNVDTNSPTKQPTLAPISNNIPSSRPISNVPIIILPSSETPTLSPTSISTSVPKTTYNPTNQPIISHSPTLSMKPSLPCSLDCQNGGRCILAQDNNNEEESCNCTKAVVYGNPYAGLLCEYSATRSCMTMGSESKHSFCTNNGECSMNVGDNEQHKDCICTAGFEGSHCEYNVTNLDNPSPIKSDAPSREVTSSPLEPPKASLSPATETSPMKPSLNNSNSPSQSPDISAQITTPPSNLAPSQSPIEQSLSKIPSSSPMNEASSVTSVVVETTYSTPSTEATLDVIDTPINNDTDDTTSTTPTQSPVRAFETFSPTDDTEMTMSPNSISSSAALQSLSILSINMMILTTIMYSLYSV